MNNTANPEKDRKESQEYCENCIYCEMCSWYPHDGCEWRKEDKKFDIQDLLSDLNVNEIKAHDTDESLGCFLNAWKAELLRRIYDYEHTDEKGV